MKTFVFRVDASIDIGTGHVMRCLTLADALRMQGGECHFICREQPGHLIEHIRGKAYTTHVLSNGPRTGTSFPEAYSTEDRRQPLHAAWLGARQEQDASDCAVILRSLNKPEWLIVDHYAIDSKWESALKVRCHHLMVIDDLADRSHNCDLLLDQTFGRNPADYAAWVPDECTLLCGSQYALLRPEFSALRPYSLHRRERPQLKQLLVAMGGVDKGNATGQILNALKSSALPADCCITVVLGATAPWLAEVLQIADQMPWQTTVRTGVGNMAQLMADSDLAIGGAGATSWERCCLGLPSILLVLAANQQAVADSLEREGAVRVLSDAGAISTLLPPQLDNLLASSDQRAKMSRVAAGVTDGCGSSIVLKHLER